MSLFDGLRTVPYQQLSLQGVLPGSVHTGTVSGALGDLATVTRASRYQPHDAPPTVTAVLVPVSVLA
jgi:hypothetical protein